MMTVLMSYILLGLAVLGVFLKFEQMIAARMEKLLGDPDQAVASTAAKWQKDGRKRGDYWSAVLSGSPAQTITCMVVMWPLILYLLYSRYQSLVVMERLADASRRVRELEAKFHAEDVAFVNYFISLLEGSPMTADQQRILQDFRQKPLKEQLMIAHTAMATIKSQRENQKP